MKRSLLAASLLIAAIQAQANVITSIAGGGTSHAFSSVNYVGSGSISENGMTWSTTQPFSAYGYTHGYGLGLNGSWNFQIGPHIGLNSAGGSMSITFDNAVSSVLAFLNYAPEFYGTPTIAIYDASNVLLESYILNIATPSAINGGADFGFSQTTANIKTFVLSNAYIVAADVRTDGTSAPVPEPATLALLGLGVVGLCFARRRKA